jgi:hypothetical protein
MTRNTKIALGCGGAGCLGILVVIAAVAALMAVGYVRAPFSANRNSNYNYNRNSNDNSNSNLDSNSNESSESSSSSLSDDQKHRLFQAAGVTQDTQLILRVLDKIGFPNGQGEGYQEFVHDHMNWALRNASFVRSILDKEKARAYVEEHIDD